MISIEKAILADICLGIPLGKIMFSMPAHLDPATLPEAPDTFLFRGEQLALMKSLYGQGDDRIAAAVAELVRAADKAMKEGPFSVTQKPDSRFSDDPRDYQSLAKYWWPNPDTKNGLPYVNRDGEVNPECYADDFDYIRLVRFSETVVLLALAGYLTGNPDYARRAALLLETWFVNSKTRQNPNFRLAQTMPGGKAPRWQAIIEARFLVYVTEAVRLISGTNVLKPASAKKIQSWFSALLKWLLESEHGRKAKAAKNNIGFWYDLQCMVYAQFCGHAGLAERIIREDVVPRLNAQMAADGSLPRELDRANPKDYVAFTLAAMVLISRAGEQTGLELWDEHQGDGHNFQVAHDWLLKAGDARQLLSAVETGTPSGDDGSHDIGMLLETGVKLRAFQRVAETEARAASAMRVEIVTLRQERKATEAGLRSQLAKAESLRGRYEAEIEALRQQQKETEADLRLQLAKANALSGERETEIEALRQRQRETEAGLQAQLAEAAALRGEREAEIEVLRQALQETEAGLQAQLAEATTLRGEREAEIEALRQRQKETEADLQAQLAEAAALRGERKAEVDALRQRQKEAETGLQAQLAEVDALRADLENIKADLKAKQANLTRLREERDARKLVLETVKQQRRELASKAGKLVKDRDALLDHARKLELQYRGVLASTSWRAMGPLRVVVRKIRSLLSGRTGRPNHIPPLPRLSGIGPGDIVLQPVPVAVSGSGKGQSAASPAKAVTGGRTGRSAAASPARVADRIKAVAREKLPPAAKEAIKTVLEGAPNTQGVLKAISDVASKVKPTSAADPLEMLLTARPRDEEALKKEYREKGFDSEPDTFAFYRIIGNDLYPRHKKGQSRENVRFLLENEPELADCERRWVVNRIIDPEEERQIITMLEAHGQPFLHIPFVADDYRKIGWDFDALPAPAFLASEEFRKLGPEQQDRIRTALYRLKNNYVMHNNGARNAALRDGREHAKWVLPWDGNGFVTLKAWEEIRQAVKARPHLKYFAVPMERVTDNSMLLRDDFTPHPVEEPQLLFRRDAGEEFNENFPYGRRPKVELFWRLGIPGPWDRWKDLSWDQKRRTLSPEAHQFGVAGWVARMNSGAGALEQKDKTSFLNRGLARQEAIVAAIDHVDALVHRATPDPDGLAFYKKKNLDRLKQALGDDTDNRQVLARRILADAERALGEKPYSVVQKTTLAPSGDPHDYWHPAPYWWPDPNKKDGLPYVRKDGQRVPGTRMYEEASAQYDRTRLQLMFDGTTALALGWYLTGRGDFARHGAAFIRTWFIAPETRMNPHLRYSQVRMGRNNNEGAPTGVIELKDLYYVLDAVRILEKAGAFTTEDSENLKVWLREYLSYLETSEQGRKECAAINNHGTYFDLQTAAIAAYLGEKEKLRDIFLRSQSRIIQQFTEAGEQPDEMKRSITQHYVFFNLQGWLNIFRLAQANGLPPGDWTKEPHARVAEAFRWIVRHDMANWPYEQIEPFDADRFYPLVLSAYSVEIISNEELQILSKSMLLSQVKYIFDPHDAIMPYWILNSINMEQMNVCD